MYKNAIDNFHHNNKNSVFYTITNGMDPEEKKLIHGMKYYLIIKNIHFHLYFSFIFIVSRFFKPKQKQYLTEYESFQRKNKKIFCV